MSVFKRGNTYWVRFVHSGKEIRKSAKTTNKRTAEKFEASLKEHYARIYRGEKPRFRFEDMTARFAEEYLPALKPRTQDDYLGKIDYLLGQCGDLYIDQIDKARIAELVTELKRKALKNATIRRYLALLSVMFSCANDWDWTETNPVKAYNKRALKESPGRVRFLTHKQYDRLLAAAAPRKDLLLMIRVAVETGMRFSEQFTLTWDQVDIARRELYLPDTKNKQPRTIPISEQLSAQIRAHPRHIKCAYVFHRNGVPYGYSSFKKRFANALKDARINKFRWHDLRHTFATWAIKGWHYWQDAPMPQERLQKWLGHTTPIMTQRYAHLDVADLHGTMTAQNREQEQQTKDLEHA